MEILQKKKIKIVPIVRRRGTLPAGHDGEFLFTGSHINYVLPLDESGMQFVEILSKEEKDFIEEKLLMKKDNLNFYDTHNPFWVGSETLNPFTVSLTKEGLELSLDNANDFIKYKLVSIGYKNQFAPSWDERNDNPEYKWAIIDKGEIVKSKAISNKEKAGAYKYISSIENESEKMHNILTVCGKKQTKDATKDLLYVELTNLIETPKGLELFLSVVNSPNFELNVLIDKAVETGALHKTGTKYRLGSPTGDVVGNDKQNLIDTLKQKKNQDLLENIKLQIANNSK